MLRGTRNSVDIATEAFILLVVTLCTRLVFSFVSGPLYSSPSFCIFAVRVIIVVACEMRKIHYTQHTELNGNTDNIVKELVRYVTLCSRNVIPFRTLPQPEL